MKDNIKKWICWVVFGLLFFIIIAGLGIEGCQKGLKVGDVVFDRPED